MTEEKTLDYYTFVQYPLVCSMMSLAMKGSRTVRLTNLGSMLDELQAILTAKGCRVTEVSVTFYPPQDGEGRAPDNNNAPHQPVTGVDGTRPARWYRRG